MTVKNSPEERQLMKIIEKMPVADEDKQAWISQIREQGLSEELAEEIRLKIHAENDEEGAAKRLKISAELANIVKRWRLTNQSQHFGR